MNKMKFKSMVLAFVAFAIVGLVFTSCEKDDEPQTVSPNAQEITDVKNATAMDEALSGIEDFIVESYGQEPDMVKFTNTDSALKSNVVGCRNITPGDDNTITSGTITVNFINPCEIKNHTYSGSIFIIYNYDTTSRSVTLHYELINFKYDGTTFEGQGTIVVDFASETEHRVHTHSFNISFYTPLTLQPNVVKFTRSGELIREWVVLDLNNFDNSVAEITGYWKDAFTTKDKFLNDVLLIERNYNINPSKPLRYEVSCLYFVSGDVYITHNNDLTKVTYNGVLDFGNGECDRKSTLTLTDNTVITIQD